MLSAPHAIQNQGPVFSRQQWDETNANPSIAERLASENGRTREQMYGVTIRRGVDLPNAIDDSTDRANLFAVIHRIWRDACDPACRSHALQAALQYRLSQEQGFESGPPLLHPWRSVSLRNGRAGWPFLIRICRTVIRWRLQATAVCRKPGRCRCRF